MAADVYAHPMHLGRGGWTWYTGSAGWMYQAAVEGLLGLRRRRNDVQRGPLHSRRCGRHTRSSGERAAAGIHITVTNPEHRSRGIRSATFDGVPIDAQAIPLVDDGRTHDVVIVLGIPDPQELEARPVRSVERDAS